MSDKSTSENGKTIGESNMSNPALAEATDWAEQLMNAECKHRREKEPVIRERLANKLKISESQLYRLQYKKREMNEVKGSVYRALLLGMHLYGLFNETADRLYQEERELAYGRNSKMVGLAALVAGEKADGPMK